MSKNENQHLATKALRHKDKNPIYFIWLAIIFSAALIANFPVTPTDISAPANSAAAATAAEHFFLRRDNGINKILFKIKTATAYRSTRSQTPLGVFSLASSGNFSAIKNEHPTSNIEATKIRHGLTRTNTDKRLLATETSAVAKAMAGQAEK